MEETGHEEKGLDCCRYAGRFVSGSLGTKEAQAIVPRVAEKAAHFDGTVIFTLDTHGADYLKTQEGRILPVPHCIKGTAGHRLVPELENLADSARKAGTEIIYVRHDGGAGDQLESGTEGWKIHEAVEPKTGERIF